MKRASDELKQFLREPNPDAADAQPPALPPHLGNLPDAAYVNAALEYIDGYRFLRLFTPVKRAAATIDPQTQPDPDQKARSYLRACVVVNRSVLASIDPSYNANYGQQRFIHKVLFKRRWALEELASEIMSLVHLGVSFG